ncbi:MAG: C40 family peptidase [Thermoleophilia bacterium]
MASKQTQAQSVRSDIATLNGQLEAKVENYNAAHVELDSIQDRITANQATLEQTTAELAVSQGRLQKRLVSMYRNGSVNVLDVLMETSDVNDFITKFDMLTKVGEQDRNDLEQVKMLKTQVEQAQSQLAADQAQQADIVGRLASEKADIEAGLGQRKSMLTGLEGEIATLKQQEQAAQQQAFQASVSTSSVSSGSGGGNGGGIGPAPPSTAGGAVGIAMQYLGVPYVWGGASPSGMDCSGLVMVVYGQLGYSLPHSAAAQYSAGTPISYNDMAPGDLVFFGYGGISHVGIYIGGGQMIHAPMEGEAVQIASVSNGGSFRGACRL